MFEYYKYEAIQKSHEGFVPRLGGFLIIIFFFVNLSFLNTEFKFININIIIGTILILIISFKEDLFGDTSPLTRMITLLLSSFIVVISFENFPYIDIPYLKILLNNYYFQIFFYTLALTALANGTNMIDGMNGLAGFTCMTMIGSLLILSYLFGQVQFIPILLTLAAILFIFLIFNFPFGLIFLGDTGAYWLGWIIGIIIINFFSSYKEISTWTALVIVSYPIIELIFSFSRKIFNKKSPFKADNKHIHIKLYYALSGNYKTNKFNSVVSLCLMPIWSIPVSSIFFIYFFPKSVIIILFIQLSVYLLFFYFIPPSDESNFE